MKNTPFDPYKWFFCGNCLKDFDDENQESPEIPGLCFSCYDKWRNKATKNGG